MRFAATFVFSLLAGSALADGCDRWTAKMEEDEGGPVMTAAICAKVGSGATEEHLLLVTCGGDALSMRYLPVAPESFPPGGNEEFKSDLQLTADGKSFSAPAQYESMDGAMAFAAKIDSAMVEAMMTGESLSVGDTVGVVPKATFPLKGSRQALEKIIGSCTQ